MSHSPGEKEPILLVEDEDCVRIFVKKVIEKAGFEVLAASSGQDAMEIFRSFSRQIRLVLSDIVMPEMSSIELTDLLLRLHPRLGVIWMSGNLGGLTVPPSRGFLQKPFTATALIERVKGVLQRVEKTMGADA